MTDVCLKRKIRNYVETVKEDDPGYRIYIKDQVPLQRCDAEKQVQISELRLSSRLSKKQRKRRSQSNCFKIKSERS